ncbi:hypothetical protein [Tahibacter soli]|uniref:Delta-60 repeat protein n=1 Tax=Tahibacter soli TaxID=2983605 RepID=A0A9X4BG40_9GAMM|nr:hypothetical protein [Tahibacter soli]MDC8011006.1 hypothetical protein [Tahibacter soli]
MSHRFVFARLALLLSTLAGTAATHAAGLVDPLFAGNGVARITGTNAQGPQSLVVKPDGRLVFAGRRQDGSGIVIAARKRNGAVDGAFNGGNVLATAPLGTAYGPRLANDVTGDATILAYTDFQAGVYRLVLCRVLGNGTFDPAFTISGYSGQAGCVRTNPPAGAPNGVIVAGVELWPNGKIAVGGTAYNYSVAAIGKPFEGSLYAGSTLSLSTIPIPHDYVINAFASEPFTDVVYFGGTIRTGSADTAGVVLRVTSASYLTATFNPNVVADGIDDVRAFARRPDGRLVAAVTADAPNASTTCVAYAMDGGNLAPDLGFGPNGNGRRDVDFGAGVSVRCDAIAADAGNNVFVVGTASLSSYDAMAVARLSPIGQNDPGYGAGGNVLVNTIGIAPTMVDERGLAAGVQEGRLILGGYSEAATSPTPATSSMLVVRLTDDDHLFVSDFE